jgi:hypothetical protein
MTTHKSKKNISENDNGITNADTPRMRKMLKMFEPGPYLQVTLAQSVGLLSFAVLALTAASVIRKIVKR